MAEFQEYPNKWDFKGDKPCPVDFHAPRCVYCKALSPILDQLAVEYDGKIDIYKVDVDQEPELEAAFAIRTIPNLLLCPMGGKPSMKLGTMNKTQLKSIDRRSFVIIYRINHLMKGIETRIHHRLHGFTQINRID